MNIENVIVKNGVAVMSENDFRDWIKKDRIKDETIKQQKIQISSLNSNTWLSVNEYAKKYGVCRATVYNYINKNKVEYKRVGKRYRVLG